jgi:hypothetical protein
MGAQWDRAGGRARVPRVADLAPFVVRQPLLFFLPGLQVLVALDAYWIAILGLLCSPLVSFFPSHSPRLILHAIFAFIIPPSQYHQHLRDFTYARTFLITNGPSHTSTTDLFIVYIIDVLPFSLSYFVPNVVQIESTSHSSPTRTNNFGRP